MQLIADILTFEPNQEVLSKRLMDTSIDWDNLVIIGSQHLMLPAIYCRLKAKNLLVLIPEELEQYLNEISNLNRARNIQLLNEIQVISKLFRSKNINHVFIKGSALLVGEVYHDVSERMIGDIDILIDKTDINFAFQLLIDAGYPETISFKYKQKDYRHLPRQISPHKIGAVELHSEILKADYAQHLEAKEVIYHKINHNGIYIPSPCFSMKIAILAFQINDYGHRLCYLNFKIIYDCLCIKLHNPSLRFEDLPNWKFYNSFLNLGELFFNQKTPSHSTLSADISRFYFVFKLNNSRIGSFCFKITRSLLMVSERFTLMVFNPSYRKHVFINKLGFKNTF